MQGVIRTDSPNWQSRVHRDSWSRDVVLLYVIFNFSARSGWHWMFSPFETVLVGIDVLLMLRHLRPVEHMRELTEN